MLGRSRLAIRTAAAQRLFILPHCSDEAIGQLGDALTIFIGAVDDLIIDVGDITHIIDLIANGAQPTGDDIKAHHDARMPHVTVVINRHAANIDAHLSCLHRRKWSLGGA